MNDQSQRPEEAMPDTQQEREAVLQAWSQPSVAARSRLKSKRGGLMILGIAAIAGGALFVLQQPDNERAKETDNLQLAERTPVKPLPKVKNETSDPQVSSQPPTETSDPLAEERRRQALQQAEMERKMREARLKSGIVATNNTSAATAAPPSEEASQTGLNPGHGGAQDANSQYARQVSGQTVTVARARQIPSLPYMILQGKIIEAVLQPRVNSDLPGTIRATVQRDVVGAQGRIPLIPWGSTLIGQYRAEISKGQSRLFPIWNRIIRPDGVDIVLDSPGADQLGTAGMGGHVDTHFAQIFGVSALLSIIGAGGSTVGVSSGDENNSSAYYREQVQQAAADSAKQVLGDYSKIPPTITVAPGTRVRVLVNRDLDFSSLSAGEKSVQHITFGRP
ncbi:TrbI/VirB10 family protein [Budviciaceae bacterium CWB-B4]|uniref:TrbI/VirB10 family protein n=1 Tax=Limnobaculum xujianqingii TaxID=2738837 RepID=A0A9D7AF62_9GAMM|nr:TrbI/VirB10 family protein [Limnobaculum xujianqingii]MBK5071616.1 TrbI/VirB10 family protein [Limnobaculum xujianqingii]MBK5174925.1 TrbI/VirB10 family protein [Limnobaculum xujianqingii]